MNIPGRRRESNITSPQISQFRAIRRDVFEGHYGSPTERTLTDETYNLLEVMITPEGAKIAITRPTLEVTDLLRSTKLPEEPTEDPLDSFFPTSAEQLRLRNTSKVSDEMSEISIRSAYARSIGHPLIALTLLTTSQLRAKSTDVTKSLSVSYSFEVIKEKDGDVGLRTDLFDIHLDTPEKCRHISRRIDGGVRLDSGPFLEKVAHMVLTDLVEVQLDFVGRLAE